jgi:hypothetical protein
MASKLLTQLKLLTSLRTSLLTAHNQLQVPLQEARLFLTRTPLTTFQSFVGLPKGFG